MIVIGENQEPKSGWICLEMSGGRRVFTQLPFDPFGDPPDEVPQEGHVWVKHAFTVVGKSMGPGGQLSVGIMGFDDPPEMLESPHLIDMRHVQIMSKMSSDSPLYKEFSNRVSPIGLIQPPQLIVPR